MQRKIILLGSILAISSTTLALQMGAKSHPAPLQVDGSENLIARLASAKGGETLRLPPGDYGTVKFPPRTYSPALAIIADQARFTSLILRNVEGIKITGGVIIGTGGKSYGINISQVKNVTIADMTITKAHRGIVMGRSENVNIVGNRLIGLLSDGIDLANVSKVSVRGNTCRDFSPSPATFDSAGKRLTVGDHPDCIQGWSRPPTPTSDVTIENNDADGSMQGIFLGNHIRNGVDDGGFDRVVIKSNRIRVDHPNGIVLINGRNSEVTDNKISTIPGSINTRSGTPVRTMIRVKEGAGNTVCGNTISDFPNSPFTKPCTKRSNISRPL